jgi:hypothetical protein
MGTTPETGVRYHNKSPVDTVLYSGVTGGGLWLIFTHLAPWVPDKVTLITSLIAAALAAWQVWHHGPPTFPIKRGEHDGDRQAAPGPILLAIPAVGCLGLAMLVAGISLISQAFSAL